MSREVCYPLESWFLQLPQPSPTSHGLGVGDSPTCTTAAFARYPGKNQNRLLVSFCYRSSGCGAAQALARGSFPLLQQRVGTGVSPWHREGRGCCGSTPGPGPCSGLGAENEAGAATRSLGINSIPSQGCRLFPVTRNPTACPWSSCFLGAGGDGVCVASEG